MTPTTEAHGRVAPPRAPRAVIAVAVLLFGWSAYAAWLLLGWYIRGMNVASEATGIAVIGCFVLGVAAPVSALAGVGLLGGRPWGWRVAVGYLGFDTLLFLALPLTQLSPRSLPPDLLFGWLVLAGCFLVPFVLLFLPSVRRWCAPTRRDADTHRRIWSRR